ncbi:MAG: CoA pyrophosphatase [Rhodocyclaceae bacterium]
MRRRFDNKQTFDWPEEGAPDEAFNPARAAVLIPIVERAGALSLLLTRRSDHLYHHPGQISFPGGSVEPGDDDEVAAALRETEEETGLPRGAVNVLGRLPSYATITGFRIAPVVGLIQAPFVLVPDAFEVAEVFEVPLAFVTDPRNYQCHRIERAGVVREFYAVPHAGRFIWGATAGMLAMFCDFLGRPVRPAGTMHER